MSKIKYFLLLLLPCIVSCGSTGNPNKFYIRLNQLGFQQNDIKSAVIISENPLFEKEFSVIDMNNRTVFEGEINDSSKQYDKFKHCYTLFFSELKDKGYYRLKVDGKTSSSFYVRDNIYNRVVDSLMLFFRVQRCGPTDPLLHLPCHLSDATGIVGGKQGIIDVTGGWHDAGDYVKFFTTTAYTTYMLLFAYDFDPVKFGFDNNKNGSPDVLDEARIGIDWLIRAAQLKDRFIIQVQDLDDHTVGYRLPENDSLQFDRPALTSIGKNQIGIFTAVMSLASRIWNEKFYDSDFGGKCLTLAENFYSIRKKAANLDNNPSGFYQDHSFWGKLALGAIEMYNTTKRSEFLEDAKVYADSAGSDYWWSWGDINTLAHYKIAKYEPRFQTYILNNLISFNDRKNSRLFNESMPFSWGTTNALLGTSLQVILYKRLTGSSDFDSLAIMQRDYVMGRNPWGISFIQNIGENHVKNIHSQIAYFKGYHPGCLSAGPVSKELIAQYDINRKKSNLDYFNTEEAMYFDQQNDYLTNEPTISSNATAVFVLGYFSSR